MDHVYLYEDILAPACIRLLKITNSDSSQQPMLDVVNIRLDDLSLPDFSCFSYVWDDPKPGTESTKRDTWIYVTETDKTANLIKLNPSLHGFFKHLYLRTPQRIQFLRTHSPIGSYQVVPTNPQRSSIAIYDPLVSWGLIDCFEDRLPPTHLIGQFKITRFQPIDLIGQFHIRLEEFHLQHQAVDSAAVANAMVHSRLFKNTSNMNYAAVANVFGTLGAVLWSLQVRS